MDQYIYTPDKLTEINSMNPELISKRSEWLSQLDKELRESSMYATHHDIQNLPEGRLIIPWGPGCSKTTAIRQFICKNINRTGVFACITKEDVDSFYYDLICKLPKDDRRKVMKVHSDYMPTTYELSKTNWIICTHARLFTDPPTAIMMFNAAGIGFMPKDTKELYRSYLLIDEYPTKMYHSISIKDIQSAQLMDYELRINEHPEYSSYERLIARYGLVDDIYRNDSKRLTPFMRSALNSAANQLSPTAHNVQLDISRGYDDTKSQNSQMRISFFYNYFMEKYEEYKRSHTKYDEVNETYYTDYEDPDYRFYYSIRDLPANNIYIFDGTGDLIFKDSEDFVLHLEPNNLCIRYLDLKSVSRIPINIGRYSNTSDEISSTYATLINNICKVTPGKSLVYTWMTSKNDGEQLADAIRGKLDNSEDVSIIHYQSGKERVTSEFSDCDNLIILGSFKVPEYVVTELNDVLGSKFTTDDYTMSLITQAIYRTKARHHKPINLYFSSDYSYEFIKELLKKFVIMNQYSLNPHNDEITRNLCTDHSLISSIKSIIGITRNELGEWIVTPRNLAEVLNVPKNSHMIRAINRKLQTNNISYKYTGGQGSRYSTYELKLPE